MYYAIKRAIFLFFFINLRQRAYFVVFSTHPLRYKYNYIASISPLSSPHYNLVCNNTRSLEYRAMYNNTRVHKIRRYEKNSIFSTWYTREYDRFFFPLFKQRLVDLFPFGSCLEEGLEFGKFFCNGRRYWLHTVPGPLFVFARRRLQQSISYTLLSSPLR